jgi:PAS domain S-box-containing protein
MSNELAIGVDRRHPADARFWPIFDHAGVPMLLLDEQRRLIEVNDAALALYAYGREELVGAVGDRLLAEPERATADAGWERFLYAGRFYGDRKVIRADGTQLRAQYAGHLTVVAGRRVGLFVILSAHPDPGGLELISTALTEHSAHTSENPLTLREREVVRLVALGQTGPQIAKSLGVASETVRTHVRNAMSKTNSHTRAQLVSTALAERLIDR